ncbi:MAG TPA: hypothetical protein VK501_13785 [Baekduia sp.]|uniref:hypothetical protein n=1 Tax=Baekduia sp. TaxID=2600305 RepID=UPI002B842A1C|nr:hypothetical protein [Baekduia sp.]HMJ34978.1 hypothetical protein [Baekduia sp.]
MNLTGVSCALKVNGSSCATMTGSIETDHANPNPSSSIPGFFSLGFPSLTMAGCCPISTGATTLTNPTTGGGIIYNYTSPSTIASQPYLWWGT